MTDRGNRSFGHYSSQSLRSRTQSGIKKNQQTSSTVLPPHHIEGRDDIETSRTRNHQSPVEQLNVHVKGNIRKRTPGWFWYIYGCGAICIFLGSFYASYAFFKLQVGSITRSNRRKCGKEDQICYKISQKEISDMQRQAQEVSPSDVDIVGITSTSNAPLSDLLPWINYHRLIGVQKFYIFCTHSEKQFTELSVALQDPKNHPDGWNYDGIELIPLQDKFGSITDLESIAKHASNPDRFYERRHGRDPEEFWLFYAANNMCGQDVLTWQTLNADEGIELALRDGIDWLAHIDSDEFLFLGHQAVHIGKLLRNVDKSVGSLKINNWEGVPEADNVSNKFKDITLFNLDKSTYHAYWNGKSIGRVTNDLIAYDMHTFIQRKDSVLKDAGEYFDKMIVLHYAHSSFKTTLGRGQRDQKQCSNKNISLDFDKQAADNAEKWKNSERSFLEWYHENFVLGDDKEEVKLQKLKAGSLTRVETPSDILSYLTPHDQ